MIILAAILGVTAVNDASVGLLAWRVCVSNNAREYSKSPEPAETVATAAFGKCRLVEDAAEQRVRLMIARAGGGYVDVDAKTRETMQDFRRTLREEAISIVLDQRAKKKP